MVSASAFPGLKWPKGIHGSQQIDQVRARRRSKDEKESDKVRERSGGRCEAVHLMTRLAPEWEARCPFPATELHHMIGGRSRGRGASALSQHKQHLCKQCHQDITGTVGGKKLERVGDPQIPFWTDKYRRVK